MRGDEEPAHPPDLRQLPGRRRKRLDARPSDDVREANAATGPSVGFRHVEPFGLDSRWICVAVPRWERQELQESAWRFDGIVCFEMALENRGALRCFEVFRGWLAEASAAIFCQASEIGLVRGRFIEGVGLRHVCSNQ